MVSERGCELGGHEIHSDGFGAPRPCCRRAGGGRLGAFAEPAALAALLGKAGHGYDLRREISSLTGGEIEVDAGGLYRVLRRLEEECFVTSHWSEGESGPQRRDYELTAEGHELAADWITHLRQRERLSAQLADLLENGITGNDSDARKGHSHE